MSHNITSKVVSLGIHQFDSFAEEKIALHQDLFPDASFLLAPPPSPFISGGATPINITNKVDTPMNDHLNNPTNGILQSPTFSFHASSNVPRSAPVTPRTRLNPPMDVMSPPRSLHNPNLFPHGPRGNKEEFLVRITVWDPKDRTTTPDLSGVASKLNRHLRDQNQDNFHYSRPPSTLRSMTGGDSSPLDLSLPAISSSANMSTPASPIKSKSAWLQPKREPRFGNRIESDVVADVPGEATMNQIRHPSLPTSPSEVDNEVHASLMKTHTKRLSFVMTAAGEKCFSHLKATSNVKVSLLKPIANLYGLSSRDTVTVTRIHQVNEEEEIKAARADHISVTIKDQFISRGGMYEFQESFLRKWIYTGERLSSVDVSESILFTLVIF